MFELAVGSTEKLQRLPVLPWWRVVTVQGTLADHPQAEARERYREEGTPLREDDRHLVRVDMGRALWTPDSPDA